MTPFQSLSSFLKGEVLQWKFNILHYRESYPHRTVYTLSYYFKVTFIIWFFYISLQLFFQFNHPVYNLFLRKVVTNLVISSVYCLQHRPFLSHSLRIFLITYHLPPPAFSDSFGCPYFERLFLFSLFHRAHDFTIPNKMCLIKMLSSSSTIC